MRKTLPLTGKNFKVRLMALCALLCAANLSVRARADYGYVQTERESGAQVQAGYSQQDLSGQQVDPDSYVMAGSNTCFLTSDDISPLSAQELCYARNEIYARHGLLFSSAELQQYFDQKNWYWGTVLPGQFSDSVLNEYEAANISSLRSREQEVGEYVPDQDGYSYARIGSYKAAAAGDNADREYIFPDSDSRYLTQADISPLSLQEICYAKNEIFARRGYIFQSKELKDYFGSKSWYTPTVPASSFSSSVFNEYESANVDLLRSYEYSMNPDGYALY